MSFSPIYYEQQYLLPRDFMKIKWKHIQQFQYFSWPMLWGSGAVSRYQVGWCAGPSTVAFMLEKIQNGSSWGWADSSVVKHSYFHRGPEFSSHHPSWCLTPHWNSSSRGPDVLSWTHSAQNKNLKKKNPQGSLIPHPHSWTTFPEQAMWSYERPQGTEVTVSSTLETGMEAAV